MSGQDTVVETPLKRPRLDRSGSVDQHSFNSQDSEPDDLFTDYDAVGTLPMAQWQGKVPSQMHTQSQYASQNTFVTQPTQIVNNPRIPNTPDRNRVQVLASSPTPQNAQSPVRASPYANPTVRPLYSAAAGASPYTNRTAQHVPHPAARASLYANPTIPGPYSQPRGNFGASFAPPGTAFRAPQPAYARQTQAGPAPALGFGVQNAPSKPPPNVIDLDDDQGMVYKGGFSDDESQDRRDIKPSVIKQRNTVRIGSNNMGNPTSPGSRFNNIMANSVYNGPARAPIDLTSPADSMKRSADLMASAYGGVDRTPKRQRQTNFGQAKQPSQLEAGPKTLDDIHDYALRNKVKRILDVLPNIGIADISRALFIKKLNELDAMELLTSQEQGPKEIDLTMSSDPSNEKPILQNAQPARTTTKQQLKQPVAGLHERYRLSSQAPQLASQRRISEVSPIKTKPDATLTAPKRRRLVQGRKHMSSSPIPIDDDSDSGVDARSDSEGESERVESLLGFFNTCAAADLMDMANIKMEDAEHILSFRPFKNLGIVREVREKSYTINPKARKQKRPMGDKVVDVCETMWEGYQAVDQLVAQCKELRKPITEGMKKWGVDVVGAAKDGEIDLVNLDGATKSPSMRDSGIGTPTASGDEDIKKHTDPKATLIPQPELMSKDITMKDYQVIGMNWLNLLFRNELSCILADDMGLGKTCQVIAFMAHLYETGVEGPNLIVVPGSTLENWLREFATFCPGLPVMSYYGKQPERDAFQIEIEERKPYVIITTYNIAVQKADRKFLSRLDLTCGVFDEGHQLKNCKTQQHTELMRISTKFRLLLTGTPLQNNLTELMSLLNFIMPDVFKEHRESLSAIFNHRAKTSESDHSALLSAQRIARARSMMAPFILRRKKDQVLQNLPKKTSRVEYCELTPTQKAIYQEQLDKAARIIALRQRAKETKEFVKESSNILSDLRKACLHPLLFRRLYTDPDLKKLVRAYLRNPIEKHRDFDLCLEDMAYSTDHNIHRYCLDEHNAPYMSHLALGNEPFLDSGKVKMLVTLLEQFKKNGDRALIFSQFVIVLDILEEVLSQHSITFFRIDGATKIEERQPLIDAFYEDESVTAFMLTTKAGGAGINLAAANKVVIFDGSFNPQDDIQAENRAHRVGQKREVEVVRLVNKGTIEEGIYRLGESKVLLDAKVAGEEGKAAAEKGEKMIKEALERELKERAKNVDVDKEAEGADKKLEVDEEKEDGEAEGEEDKEKKSKQDKEEKKKLQKDKKANGTAKTRKGRKGAKEEEDDDDDDDNDANED